MQINEVIKNNYAVNSLTRITANKLFWIISFSILTAIAAQVTIPVKPVPFTLQTMMVVLAGAFLGARNGAYSQILYLGLGIIGLPVFAQTPDGVYGFARLFGPTGGYLLAFPLAAYLTGYFIEKNSGYLSVVLSMFAGNILIVAIGTFFLNAFFIQNIEESLKVGAAIFSIWTVVKVFSSAAIFFSVKKSLKK